MFAVYGLKTTVFSSLSVHIQFSSVIRYHRACCSICSPNIEAFSNNRRVIIFEQTSSHTNDLQMNDSNSVSYSRLENIVIPVIFTWNTNIRLQCAYDEFVSIQMIGNSQRLESDSFLLGIGRMCGITKSMFFFSFCFARSNDKAVVAESTKAAWIYNATQQQCFVRCWLEMEYYGSSVPSIEQKNQKSLWPIF